MYAKFSAFKVLCTFIENKQPDLKKRSYNIF